MREWRWFAELREDKSSSAGRKLSFTDPPPPQASAGRPAPRAPEGKDQIWEFCTRRTHDTVTLRNRPISEIAPEERLSGQLRLGVCPRNI